ncbi:ABC transporter substrate-binding protein [Megalodesulfovibrio paquesii]
MAQTLVLMVMLLLVVQPARLATATLANTGEVRRVFVLQSYSSDYIWSRAINQGLQEALKESPVEWRIWYLDAKRTPDVESQQRAGQEALEQIRSFDPDVLVAVDDAALARVALPAFKDQLRPQVIFCGINAPLARYGLPAANMSGVQERWHVREGFALLQQLIPGTKTVAFLVEQSDAGGFVIDDLQREAREGGPFALELAGLESVRTFQAWKERILYYQTHADALALGLYNALQDEHGAVMAPEEVMAWTNSVNTLPTIGFSDIAMEHGLLCGILESGQEQGFLAGTMVQEVLAGVPAGQLPPQINKQGVVMLNLRTAERLQLHIPYEIIEAAGVVLR